MPRSKESQENHHPIHREAVQPLGKIPKIPQCTPREHFRFLPVLLEGGDETPLEPAPDPRPTVCLLYAPDVQQEVRGVEDWVEEEVVEEV